MTDQYLGPLVSSDEITSELRRRRRKDVYKTVSGSSKKLIAEKEKLEEDDGWRTVRKNAKSTRMAKAKPVDAQLEDEVWSILAQMGFKEMSKGRQSGMRATPRFKAIVEGTFGFDDQQPIGVDTDPVRLKASALRIFADFIFRVCCSEPALRHIQRNEDADPFVLGQVCSGHITHEQTRVSNPCIATNARAITAPSQFRTWRDHAPEQVGPYRCHVRCCSDKGFTGCGIADHGQCQIAPHTAWVRNGGITPAQPNRAAGNLERLP